MSCTYCRKAFTFGTVISVDKSYIDLVHSDRERGSYDMIMSQLDEDANSIEDMLSPFSEGNKIVYLDGCYWRADEQDIRCTGLFARHDLLVLPHELARLGVVSLAATVGKRTYWFDREREDRG